MKKKIYFIISAILQMISSIYLITRANDVFSNTLNTVREVYSSFPTQFQDRILEMMNNTGIYFVLVPAIICIVANAVILILAFGNYIERKKGFLIFLSIICIIFGSTTVSTILAIANFIILMSMKKINVQEDKRERKNLPMIKEIKYNTKELWSAAIIFGVYFSQFIWGHLIPKDNTLILTLVSIFFYTLMFILVMVLFGDKIINDFKNLKNNFSAYLEYDLPKYGLMLVSFIFVNFLCIIVTKNATSVNQEAVEKLPKFLLLLLSVFWAPVVEEVVFRGTIRRFIKNKWLFIILSSLIFGFMHAVNETSLINIFMTILPYGTLGGFLAYIYTKTGNIANNMMIHSIWNLFAMIMSLLASTII